VAYRREQRFRREKLRKPNFFHHVSFAEWRSMSEDACCVAWDYLKADGASAALLPVSLQPTTPSTHINGPFKSDTARQTR
jgi:hypothetical protein